MTAHSDQIKPIINFCNCKKGGNQLFVDIAFALQSQASQTRCFFIENTRNLITLFFCWENSKSHPVDMSLGILEMSSRSYFLKITRNHFPLLFHGNYSKSQPVVFIEHTLIPNPFFNLKHLKQKPFFFH